MEKHYDETGTDTRALLEFVAACMCHVLASIFSKIANDFALSCLETMQRAYTFI